MTFRWAPGACGSWQARRRACGLHILQLAPCRWSWLVEVDGYLLRKGVAPSFDTARTAAAVAGIVVSDRVSA